MKKNRLLLVILLVGAINLSAFNEALINGKWEIVKIVAEGRKKQENKNKEWVEFRSNGVFVTGRGDNVEVKREKWLYESDKKKLYVSERNDQIEFEVVKLTKKTLVLMLDRRGMSSKITFKKVES